MFTYYDTAHITTLVIIICFLAILIVLPKTYKTIIRIFLLTGLIATELIYFMVLGMSETSSFTSFLPLHLSQISMYIAIAVLIKPHKISTTLLYYWAIWTSLLSLFLPELPQAFPHILFFEFFVGYAFLLGTVIFILRFETIASSYRDMWFMYLILLIYGCFVWIFNTVAGSNFLFLQEHPARGQMSFLPNPPWHVPFLAAGVLIAYHILYIGIKSILHHSKENHELHTPKKKQYK